MGFSLYRPVTKRGAGRIREYMDLEVSIHPSTHARLLLMTASIMLGASFRPALLYATENHLHGAAASKSESADSTPKITLVKVLEEAKKANPELAALNAQAETRGLEANTQFYLPPPSLSVGSMGMNGPLASEGHMQTSFQFSQQIPFPTKVSRRRDALAQAAQASRSSAQARWLTVQAEVRKAYVEYWRARETQELMNQRVEVISDHKQRLRSGPLATQLMQSHLAAADTDLALAKTEIETAIQQETAARGELNALMGRDAFSPLPLAAEPPLSALPPAPGPEVISGVSETHPEILEARALSHSAEAETRAASSEYLPDFTLSYRYNRNTPLAADGSNSEVMLGISLPFLYLWQPRALNQAAESREVQAQAQLRSRQNDIKLQLLKKYAELSTLRSQYLRITEVVIPSSNRRGRISHGIAPTDMEALMEHREASERPVEFRLKALELRTGFEKALAEYESLLGVSP